MGAKKILAELFEQTLAVLAQMPQQLACPQIVKLFLPVLLNPELIQADNLFPAKGYRVTFEQQGGLAILTHRHPKPVWSKPHDHGRTWVIYGQLTGKTAMYDYTVVEGEKVKLEKSYWIEPGMARCYRVGEIHSHWTHDDSRLIRIEGINMHRKENRVGGRYYEMVA